MFIDLENFNFTNSNEILTTGEGIMVENVEQYFVKNKNAFFTAKS